MKTQRSRRTRRRALSIVLALSLAGCGSSGFHGGGPSAAPGGGPAAAPGGNLGATPGGAQDIGLAREQIARGGVPRPEAITVEGLLSEHDLPTEGPACDSLLCSRPALAIAPSLETGQREYWLQLGMTSGLSAETFRRPPLDVVVAIDRSGAMAVDMQQVNEAVSRLIAQLRDDDRIAVVAYNHAAEVLHPLGPVGDRAALQARVRRLDATGGMDMDAGLRLAYAEARSVPSDPDRLRRVIVMSCGYPNLDGSDRGFTAMVRDGAEDRIGMSFFGALLAYNGGLSQTLATTRGGAAYYLESLERIEQVFDTEFDYMVTPLAYDLHFGLEVSSTFEVARVYGIPGDAAGAPRTSFEVSTAFLSSRRGGIMVRLRKRDGATGLELGNVRLAYTAESAVRAEPPVEAVTVVREPEARPEGEAYFAGAGVRKGVALVNAAERMRATCAAYREGRRADAARIATELVAYLDAEATALEDEGLRREAALARNLLANVQR